MNLQKNRLPGVEFLRLFFMIWICLIHIWKPFKLYHGAIGVEFFFIISGLFLYNSFKAKETTLYDFSRKRIRRLFPVYFVGITLSYAIVLLDSLHESRSLDIYAFIGSFLTESLMIQDLGWFSINPVNPVSWYVSVLLIGSILIWSALRFHERLTTHILLPLFCIGYYVLLSSHGLQITDTFGANATDAIGPVFLPLGRGLAGMSIGVLIARIPLTQMDRKGFSVISVLSLVSITGYFFISKCNDYLMLLPIACLALSCRDKESWLNSAFNHRIWLFLGGITYEMLMLHIPIRYVINYGYSLFPHYRMAWIAGYLILTILSAWGLKAIMGTLENRKA